MYIYGVVQGSSLYGLFPVSGTLLFPTCEYVPPWAWFAKSDAVPEPCVPPRSPCTSILNSRPATDSLLNARKFMLQYVHAFHAKGRLHDDHRPPVAWLEPIGPPYCRPRPLWPAGSILTILLHPTASLITFPHVPLTGGGLPAIKACFPNFRACAVSLTSCNALSSQHKNAHAPICPRIPCQGPPE